MALKDAYNIWAENVKKIVGQTKKNSFLKESPPKPGLTGLKGVAYWQSRAALGNQQCGQAGNRNSGSINSGQFSKTDDVQNKLHGELSDDQIKPADDTNKPLDPTDPTTGISSDSTTATAEQLIDNESVAGKVVNQADTNSGVTNGNTTALTSISATDCDTGDSIEVRTDNNTWVPPAGWDDANTPPTKTGYEAGFHWEMTVGAQGTIYSTSYTDFQSPVTGLADAERPAEAPHTFSRFEEVNSSTFNVFVTDKDDMEVGWTALKQAGDISTVVPGAGEQIISESSTEEAWPDDSKISFVYQGGQFVTNQYDSNVPAKFKNAVSRIDFCFGNMASRTGTIEATKDNGFLLYETSGGAPTGIIRHYDSSGQLDAAFDGSSSLLDSYRP